MFPKTSLLSLDLSPVKEILVDFCAGGKQGYQTLLNLRLVCKTTKNWVESLPPAISRRIFQDVILHVEVTRQNLSHYLESPFSSIRIPNLYCEEREESFDIDILENEKDVQLIMNFVSIWKPRIESMEQIYCPLPLLPIMANLPKLRSYQCHQLFTNISDNEYEVSSLFENFPFGIERLSITHVYLNPPQKKAFYDNLIANAATLKYFGTAPFYNDFDDIFSPPSHRYPEDLPGTIQCLRQLLETKKYDPDFTLVLNFKGYSREISNEHKTALLDSVKSLLSSASNIQLHSFPEEYLQEVERVLEDDQVQKLCNLVYSVPHVLMYPHLFMKYRFPNLNQIGLTLLIGTVAGDLRSLPNLTQLGVFAPSDWAPNWPRLLVPNLTELQICTRELQWFGKASIMELVKLLSAVSECCPVLKTLILNYEITSNEIPPLEDIDHVSLQKTRIQSVIFAVKCSEEIAPLLASIFSKAVCNLPLRKLRMEFSALAVDETIFKILKTPSILENILHFSINEECVEAGAIPLLEEMKSYADGNTIRLRSSPQVMDNPKRTKRVFSLEHDVANIFRSLLK